MFLIVLVALIAVCSSDKLDRTYLPPLTAKTAGGSPGSLQTPFIDSYYESPAGSYTNEDQGVVVDAALPGTRLSPGSEVTGLGAPRVSYGSTNSKVGGAAFKDSSIGFNKFLLKSIPLEDQDPEYQTSIAKEGDIKTKLLLPTETNNDRDSNIVSYENNVDIHNYNYGFESDNGIAVGEKGVAHDGVHAQGGYSYTGDDGKVYKITYTADKDGYQPQGEHLPTPHPIPEDIQKSIEKNTKEEASGQVDTGSYDAQKYNAESDYKESDSNKYGVTQQSHFEKRPASDTPVNGVSFIQNNFPSSGLFGSSGQSGLGSSVNKPANPFVTEISNIFDSQGKPSSNFGQGLQGVSPDFSQFITGSTFKPPVQLTGFGNQFIQQGSKPQFGLPTIPQFGSFPTRQPGEFGSQFIPQAFQKPGLNSPNIELPPQQNNDEQSFPNVHNNNQHSQDFPNTQINTPSNTKPFGSSFGSNANSFGQTSQTGFVSNAYLPPSSQNSSGKPHKTSIASIPTLSANKFVGSSLTTVPQSSQVNSQDSSVSSSSAITGSEPGFDFQTPQTFNVNQQPSNVQSTAFTQTTNNQIHSSPGQLQTTFATSQINQQSLSASNTANNQSPFGHSVTGQVSQSGNYFSNTPTALPQTIPSSTSPSSLGYNPISDPSYTPTKTEKNKFTQSSIYTENKSRPELSQSIPSNSQSVFSTQLPISSQQFQSTDHSYYYKQPAKPFITPSTRPQVSFLPHPNPTTTQLLQNTQLSNFQQSHVSQNGQFNSISPISNTPKPAQLTQTSSLNKQPTQPSFTTISQGSTSFPFQSPTLSPSFPQKPVQQSFPQPTIGRKPSTSEVGQPDQSNIIALPGNKKPSQFGSYTPQKTPAYQYTGELYQYNKPSQQISSTGNKNSALEGQKELHSQIESLGTSTLQFQQSHEHTSSHLATVKPQNGQSQFVEQGNTQTSNIPTSSLEQSKPGFSTQSHKPFGSTSQFGSKPITTSTQFGTQQNKPVGSTTQFGVQSYKPFISTTQFGSQPVKPTSSSFNFGAQTSKPFGSTSQSGVLPTKPLGSTSQFGTPSYKPSINTYKPFGSALQLGTQPVKPQIGQNQQSAYGQTQTAVLSSQSGFQTSKPIGSEPSTSSSLSEIGGQTSKPQFNQQGQNTNTGSINTNQFGTQPLINQPIFGTSQSSSQGLVNQYSGQPTKPTTIVQTGPQHQLGPQSKPQFSQTYLTNSNNQQQSLEPTQLPVQFYKPFSTASSNEGASTHSKFDTETSKLQEISQQVVNAGNSQSTQGTVQKVSSHSSETHFGVQSTKPVTTQQKESTKYQFGAQLKPILTQNQQNIQSNKQQPYVNSAFGSESYKPFGANTLNNFDNQQIKYQFGQDNFPAFEDGLSIATATSQSFPGFQFSNAFSTSFNPLKSQFGSPSHSIAFALTTSTPDPYEYNKPTSDPFAPFGSQTFNQFGDASTSGFPSSQPDFVQSTTPSYSQKQPSFENKQGSSTFSHDSFSQIHSQTIKSPTASQASVIPQSLPSKPSSLTSACCKSSGITQSTQSIPNYGSTSTPTFQSSVNSQIPQDLSLQSKPEKGQTIKGESFNGPQQPQRFDEKSGYYY